MVTASLERARRRTSSVTDGAAPADRSGRRPGSLWSRADRSRVGELSEEDKGRTPLSGRSSSTASEDADMEMELEETQSDGVEDDEEAGLTGADRQRRRKRRRRNTMLDARVVGEGKTSKAEQALAKQSVLQRSMINGVLIGLWYLFSLSISIYNKWMFSKDHLNFHYPLFTTSMHMLVQFSMASMVLYFVPRFRPRHDSISSPDGTGDRRAKADEKPLMTRSFYLTRIGPCGAATGLDIGLGNMSLRYITLTFYTMCKSSSLAFVLIFAFVFHLESPSVRLVLIIATMTVGVVMMVAGETFFDATGFILVISAAFFSGFRWALTQILLLRNPATSNPFSSIFFLAPVMFVSLLVIALPVEGVSALAHGLGELAAAKGVLGAFGILLFPGILAFLMTSSEFALLQRTSVVTLSICGIFKEVVTISAAGIVFHDPLTPINISGLLVTIASIAAYNYIKIAKMRADAAAEVHGGGGGEGEYARVEAAAEDDDSEAEASAAGKPPEGSAGAGAVASEAGKNHEA
ncbi:MAG: Triose-phosphate Transporter [Thelocarpon impressellum]|nr:MAG: Triose-phosphate Transporter [Thelocarpon impressellum]